MLKDNILKQIVEHNMDEAFIMMYFFDQVIIGIYSKNNGLFIPGSYDENLLDEIHIFNPKKEIRWTREYREYVLIQDTKDYFEESMYLIGNKSIVKDGYSIVTQYGRKMVLPFEYHISSGNHNLALIVHHLFSDENSCLQGYRLVNIAEVK